MKQDVIEYMVDSFVDFKGEERKIVACALSQAAEVSEDDCVLAVGWVAPDEYICTNDPDYARILVLQYVILVIPSIWLRDRRRLTIRLFMIQSVQLFILHLEV